MQLDRIAAFGEPADPSSLCAELVRAAGDLGFERVGAMLVTENAGCLSDFANIGNTPEGFLSAFNDREAGKLDPAMQRAKRVATPVIYDQSTYVAAGVGELWEAQAPFGYRTGILVSIRLTGNVCYALGIDREEPIPDCPETRGRVVADLLLMAAYSADAARRLLRPIEPLTHNIELTPREREILTWTVLGKSSWVIGELLGLSVGTVNFHLRNVMRKFGVSSKYAAGLQAFRLGLIRP